MIAIIVALAMTAGTADASRSLRSGTNNVNGYYGYNGMAERRHQNNVPVRRLLDPSPNQPSEAKNMLHIAARRGSGEMFVEMKTEDWYFVDDDGTNLGVEIQSEFYESLSSRMDLYKYNDVLSVEYKIITTRINSEYTKLSINFEEMANGNWVGTRVGKTDLPPGIHIEGRASIYYYDY
jgi:hypothetical protein